MVIKFQSDKELYNRIGNNRNVKNKIYMIKNYVPQRYKNRNLQNAEIYSLC